MMGLLEDIFAALERVPVDPKNHDALRENQDSKTTHCLKIIQNVSSKFFNLDLSGYAV